MAMRQKYKKMAITQQPLMLDAKFFSSKDAEYPSSYLLSIYYISLKVEKSLLQKCNVVTYL